MKLITSTIILLVLAVCAYTQLPTVSGYVRDPNGNPVAGANVSINGGAPSVTEENGYFVVSAVNNTEARVRVSADGFADYEGTLSGSQITIILEPAAISEKVMVARTDSQLGDTPQSVVVIGSRELASTPAVTLDDKLRRVPGFTLFRRSGSRTANPTSQGVSLRGTGGSGASRAAVIVDGIPINDPFGGWIYWGRVPTGSIDTVEVLRGSAGELFGGTSIGGAVSINTRRPSTDEHIELETSYGTQDTPLASVFATAGRGPLSMSLAGEAFATDGYIAVSKEQRGAVDTNAGVRRSGLIPSLSYSFSNNSRLFGSAEYFEERRTNGTPLQNNDTKILSGKAGVDFSVGNIGEITLRGWLLSERYHQSFSSIAADRNSETLTRLQTVPSRAAGLSATWIRTFSEKATVFGGIEVRNVQGASDEIAFTAGRPSSFVNAGGRELTFGAFTGLSYNPIDRLVISGGIRADRWSEFAGYSDTRPFTGTLVTRTNFTDRSETAVSPRLSALYRLGRGVSITGSYSTGFRQPTLNELYRSFRVGNVLTLASQNLGAERSRSGEAGIIASGFGNRLYVRTVGYCISIDEPVANVTLTSTPSLITRQRQNLGSIRACGIEADGQFRVRNDLDISAGYLLVDSQVTTFPANRSLEGLKVPQVARNQFTFQARYTNPSIATFSIQLRSADSQFDDDQNQFQIAGFAAVDLYASRRVNRSLDLYVAAENVFNNRIEAGKTPITTLTGPRTIRIGLMFSLGR